MFADNLKISDRQVRRLLILHLFGITSLFLPKQLAGELGRDGAVAILLGMLGVIVYLCILFRITKVIDGDYLDWIKKICGKWIGDFICLVYYIQFLIIGAYALRMVSDLIQQTLLVDTSENIIMLAMVFICAYSCIIGMEGRARLAEILFLAVVVPLIIMLILAAKDMNLDYLAPIMVEPVKKLGEQTYVVVAAYSTVAMTLFLIPYVKNRKNLFHTSLHSTLWIGICNLLLFVLCIGTFGVRGMQGTHLPVVTLMTSTKVPGSFLERWDPLMIVVWIICIFIYLSGCLFFGTIALKKIIPVKKPNYYLIPGGTLIYMIAIWISRYEEVYDSYGDYMRYVGAPIFLVLPVLFLLLHYITSGWRKKKMRKV